MCEMSARPLGIRGSVMEWVFCPHLVRSKKNGHKINIKICEECRFFIGIKNTGRLGEIAYGHKSQIKRAGGRSVKMAGHIRTRPIIGIKAGLKSGERKNIGIKTVYITKELKDGFNPLVDVFDEGDRVRVLTEIPLHYLQEEITLECGKKNGNGELIIHAGDYERHVPINGELAAELTGDVEMCSLRSGVINAELKKQR